MKHAIQHLLGVGFFWMGGILNAGEIAGGASADAGQKVTVRVYNYAQVPADVVIAAQREVARIFQQINVEVVWREIPLPSVAEPANPEEPVSIASSGPRLTLLLLPRAMAKGLAPRTNVTGWALPGGRAYVFYHRVEKIVQELKKNPCLRSIPMVLAATHPDWARRIQVQVLALAMAHEIGHLLLGSNAHSPTGIMQAVWRRTELQLGAQGKLLFTSEQGELMRTKVVGQIAQQEAKGAAELESAKLVALRLP